MAKSSGRESSDERVSLAPLTPEEALRALLAVKPDDEPAPVIPHRADGDAGQEDNQSS